MTNIKRCKCVNCGDNAQFTKELDFSTDAMLWVWQCSNCYATRRANVKREKNTGLTPSQKAIIDKLKTMPSFEPMEGDNEYFYIGNGEKSVYLEETYLLHIGKRGAVTIKTVSSLLLEGKYKKMAANSLAYALKKYDINASVKLW